MWDIIERTNVVPRLQSSLRVGRLPNAYLLAGPAHVGKMTLALNLARALNCDAAEKPCGECIQCRKINAGKHADVRVIGLDNTKEKQAKEIGIEQVRDIQHSASLPPFEGRYKVFIIDGAELLSNEAANCLLKTLEEPVGNVIYILLTVNERLLLPTVVSRCQRLELMPLSPAAIEKELLDRGVETDSARLFSRLAHGCPGWAISASNNEFLTDERAEKMEKLLSVMRAGMDVRFDYAYQLAMQFSRSRQSVQDELGLWLDWWHDLLLDKIGSPERITNIDFAAAVKDMAAGYDLMQIRMFISRIQEAGVQLNLNCNPRLVLEVLMLHIPGSNT